MKTTKSSHTKTPNKAIAVKYIHDTNLARISGWNLKGRLYKSQLEELLTKINRHLSIRHNLKSTTEFTIQVQSI